MKLRHTLQFSNGMRRVPPPCTAIFTRAWEGDHGPQ